MRRQYFLCTVITFVELQPTTQPHVGNANDITHFQTGNASPPLPICSSTMNMLRFVATDMHPLSVVACFVII